MKYNYNKRSALNGFLANKTAILLLKSFFNPKSVLINTPEFQVSPGTQGIQNTHSITAYFGEKSHEVPRVVVRFFYYQLNISSTFSEKSLKILVTSLTELYQSVHGQSVIVDLELVRQYRPYMDAEILAQYLAINASKYGFNRLVNSVLSTIPYLLPAKNGTFFASEIYSISGVKIQLSGLLTSQRNRSRKSVYTASAGTFHKSQPDDVQNQVINHKQDTQNLNIQYASHTTKSQLGSFTVKV